MIFAHDSEGLNIVLQMYNNNNVKKYAKLATCVKLFLNLAIPRDIELMYLQRSKTQKIRTDCRKIVLK